MRARTSAPSLPRSEPPVVAFVGVLLVAIAAGAVAFEFRTATLGAWLLSRTASSLQYSLSPGRSPSIVFPRPGPADEARGYSRLPALERRLAVRGFRVEEQVRFSPQLARLARAGISPPYRDPASTGLTVLDAEGAALHGRTVVSFGTYEDVPPLVARAATFIEDRHLLEDDLPGLNPVVNWGRFAHAGLSYAGRKIGLPLGPEGGSTLATQTEKYMHSPGGRTVSPVEKLRQIAGATLRVYRDGTDTRVRRREILLDYLDTMPLGAVPGYGEVLGLPEGLHAWFGIRLDDLKRDLAPSEPKEVRARAFKQVLALLCAVQAPSRYLVQDREALEARVDLFTRALAERGILDEAIASRMSRAPIELRPGRPARHPADKASMLMRTKLLSLTGLPSLYELDRLHLVASTTLDSSLQRETERLLASLSDRSFLEANGLTGERLLERGDPSKVVYTAVLYERTALGDVLRVATDTSGQPFDMNRGTKVELGSTAKLRTLAHYLEVMYGLFVEVSAMDAPARATLAKTAADPLTAWTATTLLVRPALSADGFLQACLDRKYSAAPWEAFTTGGGTHLFHNFDEDDDGRVLSVHEATVRSTNLVFIRLMRDLVRYHAARLPYDARDVIENDHGRARRRMLEAIAAEEAHDLAAREGIEGPVDMTWIFRTHSRSAQELRLRRRIEEDAFRRMAPAWRRLGFPFRELVPSLATAIGSSADRPDALAHLVGIVSGGGFARPAQWVQELRFGPGTPYETVFRPVVREPVRVLPAEVADAIRSVLVEVVERGTARRASGALKGPDGEPLPLGGKTGSGDNRVKKIARGGGVISSVAVSRTATFAFFAADRYYGVVTASVFGPKADGYGFTSALPVSIVKLLAPALSKRIANGAPRHELGLVAQSPAHAIDEPSTVGFQGLRSSAGLGIFTSGMAH